MVAKNFCHLCKPENCRIEIVLNDRRNIRTSRELGKLSCFINYDESIERTEEQSSKRRASKSKMCINLNK